MVRTPPEAEYTASLRKKLATCRTQLRNWRLEECEGARVFAAVDSSCLDALPKRSLQHEVCCAMFHVSPKPFVSGGLVLAKSYIVIVEFFVVFM